MRTALELLAETSAAAAAVLWFASARVRLRRRVKSGLAAGMDDQRALLQLIYRQSRWSAWAAIAAGLAAIFALLEGVIARGG